MNKKELNKRNNIDLFKKFVKDLTKRLDDTAPFERRGWILSTHNWFFLKKKYKLRHKLSKEKRGE